ncbi:MAG TPA: hypothetical protein VLJ60_03020 [bacterium]|nr:hypothetical protein [bacterium]
MKKITLISVVMFALLFAAACSMVKYKKGDQTKGYLSGIKKIAVQYDYSTARVGKFATEGEYVDSKVEEHNKKEAGKGDEWKAKWESQKTATFATKFESLVNEYTKDKSIEVGSGLADAELTMVVRATYIEPGWNIGISRQDASISLKIEIYKTGDMNTSLVEYEINNVPGRGAMGFDFDAGYRLGEAFGLAGKELGKFLVKE